MVVEQQSVSELSAEQLRELTGRLLVEVRHKQALIDKLTHENALLKRLKFAAQSERYSAEQRSLLDETLDADLQAVSDEIEQITSTEAAPREKQQARRQPLPANLPRREIRHEPESTTCGCGCQMKRIGEDVAEKLDYQPGVFTVERHVRGKWACTNCETLVQVPVEAHIIDKGIPTTGLLAQVLVAKFADHLPLYRQEKIFGRAGFEIPRSTLAQWVGSCGVQSRMATSNSPTCGRANSSRQDEGIVGLFCLFPERLFGKRSASGRRRAPGSGWLVHGGRVRLGQSAVSALTASRCAASLSR